MSRGERNIDAIWSIDFPGAQAPFGSIQFSPNTKSRGAGGNYRHGDNCCAGTG